MILSCTKKDIDCEYIEKACNEPNSNGIVDCALVIECKRY